jgi:glutathione peroxidase
MGLLTCMYGGVTSEQCSGQASLFDWIPQSSSSMKQYQGSALLIVNTATKCGFASQYDALEGLYQKYRERGLVVLGFPSNDFLSQEPGNDEEIQATCRINHGVTFPLLPKAPVTGSDRQPVFTFLTEHGASDLKGAVRWNFEKFLIDKHGHLRGRWRSYVSPTSRSVIRAVESVLKG